MEVRYPLAIGSDGYEEPARDQRAVVFGKVVLMPDSLMAVVAGHYRFARHYRFPLAAARLIARFGRVGSGGRAGFIPTEAVCAGFIIRLAASLTASW